MSSTEQNHYSNEPQNQNKEKKVSITVWLVSVFIALALGAVMMYFLDSSESEIHDQSQEPIVQQDKEVEVTTPIIPEEFSAITELYQILEERYSGKVDLQRLVEGALSGMAASVDDPYTVYLNSEESKALDSQISGSFEGIGAEVMKDGNALRVISPIADSPAQKAGLLPNDLILSVDSQSVADLNVHEAVNLIRGEKGTTVELLIERDGQQQIVEVVRDEIPVQSFKYDIIDGEEPIGHVHITSFNEPTYLELLEALKHFENQGIQKVVFDVRGNPGGLLKSALQLSNLFVPNGEPIMQSKTTDQEEPHIYHASEEYGDLKFTNKAVLLIDEGSASASEIFAGALSSVGIPLVGQTSFGKGTIQSIIPLKSGGDIKLTIGEWLTAHGEKINEVGISPDVSVKSHELSKILVINPEETYQRGNSSEVILSINHVLNLLGYEVTVDQEFSEETEKAIREFQMKNELTVDGIVTGETAKLLNDATRQYLSENDPQLEAAIQVLLSGKSPETLRQENAGQQDEQENSQDSKNTEE